MEFTRTSTTETSTDSLIMLILVKQFSLYMTQALVELGIYIYYDYILCR
jgi:hypothetical protein